MTTALDSTAALADSSMTGVTKIVLDRSVPMVEQLYAAESHIDAAGVCLDFAEIETVSSAELSALIRFSLWTRRCNKTVSLSNVGPHLEEIFEITRFGAWSPV